MVEITRDDAKLDSLGREYRFLLDHADKVSICRDYAEGNCTFSDDMCWFSHNEGQGQRNTPEYNCDLCNKVFKGRFELMKHRKLEHRPSVTTCRHALYGACMFGEDRCWCVHETNTNDKMIQNNQERIVQMETVL